MFNSKISRSAETSYQCKVEKLLSIAGKVLLLDRWSLVLFEMLMFPVLTQNSFIYNHNQNCVGVSVITTNYNYSFEIVIAYFS